MLPEPLLCPKLFADEGAISLRLHMIYIFQFLPFDVCCQYDSTVFLKYSVWSIKIVDVNVDDAWRVLAPAECGCACVRVCVCVCVFLFLSWCTTKATKEKANTSTWPNATLKINLSLLKPVVPGNFESESDSLDESDSLVLLELELGGTAA